MLKILKILLVLLALMVLGLAVFIYTFDANQYKAELTRKVEEATGRQLEINGDIHLRLFHFPTMVVEEVSLSNAEWGKHENLASIKRLELDVPLIPLLKSELLINKFILVEPKIHLETNQDGKGNWELTEPKEEETESTGGLPFQPSINEFKLENAFVSYLDGQTGKQKVLDLEVFDLNKASETELETKIKGAYQSIPFELSSVTGRIVTWLENEQFPINLKANINDNAKLSLDGYIQDPNQLHHIMLEVESEIASLADLSTISDTPLPQLESISLKAQLTKSAEQYALDKLNFELGDNQLAGTLSADLSNEKPMLRADLTADTIDVRPYQTMQASTETTDDVSTSDVQEVAETEHSNDTLPVDLLSSLNADIKLKVQALIAEQETLNNIDIAAKLNNGKLAVSPLSITVEEGVISGNINLDASRPKVNISANLAAENLTLSKLPELESLISGATTDIQISAKAVGETVEQLTESVSGTLKLKAGETAVKNVGWASEDNIVSLKAIDLDAEFIGSAEGKLQVNHLLLSEPIVQLETNKEGIGNWTFSEDGAPNQKTEVANDEQTNSASAPMEIILKDIQIQQAGVSYLDGQSDQKTQVDIASLLLATKDADLLSIDTAFTLNEEQFSIAGTMGKISTLLKNEPFPVDLKSSLNKEVQLHVKGKVESPLTEQKLLIFVDGKVDDYASISKLADTPIPALKPISLKANLNRDQQKFVITDLDFKHGVSDLSGHLTIDLSAEKSYIDADLKSKLIDLSELPSSDEKEAKQEKKKSDKVFPSDPLPLEMLNTLNGQLKINADKINTGTMLIEKTAITAVIKNGNIVMNPVKSMIAGGQLAGDIKLSNGKKTAALDTNLTIKGLKIATIGDLKEVIDKSEVDAHIKLTGKGKSVSEIMAGANGLLTVEAGPGKLNVDGGFMTSDLLTSLIPIGDNSEGMDLHCAVVNYQIENGTALSDKGLVLLTNKLSVIGSSKIDLKTEALDITLNPEVREGLGIGVGELASMVRIGGTLANPTPGADLGSTLQAGLKLQSAIATGGLSILASNLFDKLTEDENPCQTAMARAKEPPPPVEADTQTPTTDVETKQAPATEETATPIQE